MKKARWARVGAGFVNKDGSINVRVDQGMALFHGQDYQLRDPKPEGEEAVPRKQ